MSQLIKDKMKVIQEKLDNTKADQNYMKIKLNYTEMVFPYVQGIKVVEALRYGEEYDKEDWNNPKIIPLGLDRVEISIISKKDYDLMKMSTLLNIPYKELKKYEAMSDEEVTEEDGINEGSD